MIAQNEQNFFLENQTDIDNWSQEICTYQWNIYKKVRVIVQFWNT